MSVRIPPRAKRALVVSDSDISRDPRVLRQIGWLTAAGWGVDTLGRGPAARGVDEHFIMLRRSAAARVLSYLFLPNPVKYRLLVSSTIPAPLQNGVEGGIYDLVLLNEIELLPWFVAQKSRIARADSHTHLDLHEYAPSQRSGIAYRLVFKRFRDWLAAFISSPEIDTRSTVSGGIADLYAEHFGVSRPAVVRSTPAFVDQPPSAMDEDRIRLIHHGTAAAARALDVLVSALALTDERISLDFMLVATDNQIATLRRQAEATGARVTFRPPVSVTEISTAINKYDAEVIFFPPVTENLRLTLPNKFFEAVQGRLALIIGDSSEMAELVRQYGNGLIVSGWSAPDLARALNSLTVDRVAAMKQGSDAAARALSAESEGTNFLAAMGIDPVGAA